jgi:hypothetical protein
MVSHRILTVDPAMTGVPGEMMNVMMMPTLRMRMRTVIMGMPFVRHCLPPFHRNAPAVSEATSGAHRSDPRRGLVNPVTGEPDNVRARVHSDNLYVRHGDFPLKE